MKRFSSLVLAILLFAISSAFNPPPINKAHAEMQKTVCLTFDDGPSFVTEEILDVLAEFNVKATFFVCGVNVKKHPQILARIFKEGHTVGIHTHTHDYKSIYASPDALKNDINACLRAIKAVNSNYEACLYRFPGGSFNLSDELKAVPLSLGLTPLDWNASCRDCEIKPEYSTDLYREAMATSAGKSRIIMLLHDAPDKHLTALALPDIIKDFRKKGFSFLTAEKVVKIS